MACRFIHFSITCTIMVLFCLSTALAQNWAKVFQGDSYDIAISGQQLSDGSTYVAGDTASFGAGSRDIAFMKIDPWGSIIWQETLGSTGDDGVRDTVLSWDGGVLIAGLSTSFTAGTESQLWIISSTENGDIVWQQLYSSPDYDSVVPTSILRASDQGYLITGTCSLGVTGKILMMKIDNSGSILWQNVLDTSFDTRPSDQILTTDRGSIVVGFTETISDDYDIIVIKLDEYGTIEWQKQYGDSHLNKGVSILEMYDGGYLVSGDIERSGGVNQNVFIMKLDVDGSLIWQQSIGGNSDEKLSQMIHSGDGNYMLTGTTTSFGSGWQDLWLGELTQSGSMIWEKSFGSSEIDIVYDLVPTIDLGYLLIGSSESFGSNDEDVFLIKVDQVGSFGMSCFLEYSPTSISDTPTMSETDTTFSLVTGTLNASATSIIPVNMSFFFSYQCYGCTPDIYELDNSCGITTSSPISGNYRQTHNLCNLDADWIAFHSCPGQVIEIETSNLGMDANTVFELYDDTCSTVLTTDDDGGQEPKASRLEWTAPVKGTYYLKVTQEPGFVSNIGAIGNFSYYDVNYNATTTPCSTWARTYSTNKMNNHQYIKNNRDSGGPGKTGVLPTSDSGYIAGGTLDNDYWVMKMDRDHTIEWEQTLGGTGDDYLTNIEHSGNGGVIISGSTNSFGMGGHDGWLTELSDSGSINWQKSYGTAGDDYIYSVKQTDDDGYIICGTSSDDLWLAKCSAVGNILWQYQYGGPALDVGSSVQQTKDGGYFVAGYTESFGAGSADILILRLDASGNVLWTKTYGGLNDDRAQDILVTEYNSLFVIGTTNSFGPDTPSYSNIWIMKLNNTGFIEWQYYLGGSWDDEGTSICATSDGYYVLTGHTQKAVGDFDLYVAKISQWGDIVWQHSYGTSDNEYAYSVRQLLDNGYIIGGHYSPVSGNQAFFLKLPSNGDLTSGCPLREQVTYSFSSTTATITYPSLIVNSGGTSTQDTLVTGSSVSTSETELCNLSLPAEVSPPGATQYLVFLDQNTLYWEEGIISDSDFFNLYRGSVSDLSNGYYGNCYASDIPSNTTTDASIPTSGTSWFYLVTGENEIGEGPLGSDYLGNPRSTNDRCP